MTLLMIVSACLFGRITEWHHYTHFGGVSNVLVEGSTVAAATTGGVAFGTIGSGSIEWDSTWTAPGELSMSDVRCLARDDDGNLWIGTRGGGIDVSLSSGGFERYGQLEGLPVSLQVNCLYPDTAVWAGTTEGLCVKELEYFDIWTVYNTGGGLPSANVTALAPVDSGLFVGTSGGLVMLRAGHYPGDPDSWLSFEPMENLLVHDILVTPDSAWAATGEGLYLLTDPVGWRRVTAYPGSNPVSLAWREGKLAVGGKGDVAVFEDSEWTLNPDGLAGQVVQDIEWLTADSLLIGQHENFALNRASGNGVALGVPGSWSSSLHDGAPSNDILAVAVDARRDVWVTTNRRGASVLSVHGWTDFVSELPSKNQVFACLADGSGGVFVAPWHFGVAWIDWKGTPDREDDEVVIFNVSSSGLLNDQVRDMAVSPSGDVWFAHEPYWQTPSEPSGVTRLSWTPGIEGSASWEAFRPSDGLPSGDVRAVETASSPHRAWMGTREGLVLGSVQTGQVIETYTSAAGLPSSDVQSLALSRDGRLYVGTVSGLAAIDTNSGSVATLEQVPGDVSMLCMDNLSRLWAASGEGLYRLSPDGSFDLYSTINSPIQSHDVRGASCDFENGYLYLATDHGLWKLVLEQGMGGELGTATVYPNPFLPGDGHVLGVAGISDRPFDITLFDLTGGLVYESTLRSRDEFAWDGADMDGHPAASGTYIVRIVQDGADRFIKLAIVR